MIQLHEYKPIKVNVHLASPEKIEIGGVFDVLKMLAHPDKPLNECLDAIMAQIVLDPV